MPEPSVLIQPKDFPIPDGDYMVIEILTDQMIDFDESSTDVLEIFVVIGGDKKRVEANDGKTMDGDRNLFRRAKEAELDHKVFDVVNMKVADKDRVMKARWVSTVKSTGKAKARLCALGFQDPDLTDVLRDSSTLSSRGRGLDLTVRGDKQWEAGVRRYQDGILVRRRGAPQHLRRSSRWCSRHSETQPRVNAQTSQSCVWSREHPEGMGGGSVETLTSESWIRIPVAATPQGSEH